MSALDPRRAAVVAEAESWLKTPFHHGARVKGAGVDCGQFLIAVYAARGFMPAIGTPYYPPDFAQHNAREWYAEIVATYAREFAGPPEPGDVVLFRWGKTFSHGGIVVAWPRLIHAYKPGGGVCWGDAEKMAALHTRPHRFFTPF